MSDQPPEASANSAIASPPTKPSALVSRIKSLSERIVGWGDKSDFVKLLELLGKFGLVIAAGTYLFEIPAQRQAREDALKAKRYQAWALINSAQGSAADGGRRDALQDLNEDRVSLTGAYLAKAFLSSIKLPKADLGGANLSGAHLISADLTGANLISADLTGADLSSATLTGAILGAANLTDANLYRADLNGAMLIGANLSQTVLLDADLANALLVSANLNGADLTDANLTGSNLNGANLTGANLNGANLTGAKIDQKQLDEACGSDATVLPTATLTLKPCPPKSSP
jgi:uncharacterized protein YjbI with pentapeptide repeats